MIYITMYLGGLLFGLGLAVAGATKPEVVLSFLRLEDLGLVFVIGGAFFFTLLVFQGVPKLLKKPPYYAKRFDVHDGFPVTRRSVVGAVIFGLGWGLSGICPATSLASVGTGNWPLWLAVGGMLLGSLIYGLIRGRQNN